MTAPAKPFIHESAYVDDGATIGVGTKIWHFCHIMPGAVIGDRCSLGQNVVVMNGTRVGNNCKIQNNVSIYEGVELEDDVFCGPSMVFTNVINPRSQVSRKNEYRRTLVRRGTSIGANATIVCGITLGEYSFIGAGAVVTHDVLDYALMVGVPARRVGWMCQCGERLPDSGEGRCEACSITYESTADGIRRAR
jgi:UDP-2-acetamido-3-amino-2,3-dideoxy-glucuronate N-acetyltransferase